MCGLNGSEFLIIVVVAVIVLGPDRLPELMRLLGRGVREVRTVTRGFSDVQKEIRSKVSVDELRRQIREELMLEEREASGKRQTMQSEADAVRARKAARATALPDPAPTDPETTEPAPIAHAAGIDDEEPLPDPPVQVRPAQNTAAATGARGVNDGGEPG